MTNNLGDILLDEDKQPKMRWINHKRLTDRSIDELLGLCKGLVADNTINQKEAEYILNWLQTNKLAADIWPGNVIVQRIAAYLEDGVLDSDESADLLSLLQEATGEQYQTLTVDNMSADCYDCPQPQITFQSKRFCLTGKFALGPRKECEREVKELGGTTTQTVSGATDFLIIGTIGSTDWMHSSFGRKIEQAKKLQGEGSKIAIISEDHWAKHL